MRLSLRVNCLLVLVGTVSISGCATYKAKPLVPMEIIDRMERIRGLLENQQAQDAKELPTNGLSFPCVAEWMDSYSPLLREVRLEYETATNLTNIKTPFPNPTIDAGPSIGRNLEAGAIRRIVPFVGLGFSIPLGGRIARQDDVNLHRANLAYTRTVAEHRMLYLELRRAYISLALNRSLSKLLREASDLTDQGRTLGQALLDRGATTIFDQGILELEHGRSQLEIASATIEGFQAEAELSRLTGVGSSLFRTLAVLDLPEIPDAVPEISNLKKLLIDHHPRLAVLRAEYEVAESELRLEIAKQIPDIQFGATHEGESGERKSILGLVLGIEVPLFDRNQQSVYLAEQKREEIRLRFESMANEVFAELEKKLQVLQVSMEKMKVLNSVILPVSKSMSEKAVASLREGGIDSIRYIEIQRGRSQALVDTLATELDIAMSWIDLERAVGYPLLHLQGEQLVPVPWGKSYQKAN